MGLRRLLIALLTTTTVFTAVVWPSVVHADPLQSATDYLNRQQADITSGISHHLFFTPATNMFGGGNVIRLVFPQSPVNTWCRVGGAGLSVVGVNDPPGVTEGATPLPGSLTANCTVGNGLTTFDTITISNIDPFMAGIKYGVAITDPGTAKLGTPPAATGIQEILTTNNGSADIDSLTLFTATIPSDQLTVSAIVVDQNPIIPNPMVNFSGYAGSAANLTITRGDTVVYAATLGVSGQFNVSLADQPVGEQMYLVSAMDSYGNPFSSLTFVLNLQLNTTTTLSNIFLGPTISIDKTSFTLGEAVTISGKTVPGSEVTLDISTVPLTSYSTTADGTGTWQSVVSSTDLGVGTFVAHARAVFSGNISVFGPQITLTIAPSELTDTNTSPPLNTNQPSNTNTPPANINTGPSNNTNRPTNVNKPAVELPTKISSTDLNKDNRINLIDFSILIFYWHQHHPANPAADVNQDGTVDIIDVSIMLFQWTAL